MAAAESRTEGTECSSCSVVFERGIRCGLGGWVAWSGCGDGGESGSISLSKIAEEEECLVASLVMGCEVEKKRRLTRKWGRRG